MMLWQLVRARFWELRGFKRKAGGIRAARSRRLNEEAKKFGAASLTANDVPHELSGVASEPK